MINHPHRTNPILQVVRATIARRHTITRSEMADLLVKLGELRLIEMNGWCGDAPYHAARKRVDAANRLRRAEIDAQIAEIRRRDPLADIPAALLFEDLPPSPTVAELASAWAAACRDITVISVLDDSDPVEARLASSNPGTIRYDQPGSMHPLLRATLMFATARCCEMSDDYLRRHCRRLLIVADEPEAAPSPSAVDTMQCTCDSGHRWETDDPERDWRCPVCGEPAV